MKELTEFEKRAEEIRDKITEMYHNATSSEQTYIDGDGNLVGRMIPGKEDFVDILTFMTKDVVDLHSDMISEYGVERLAFALCYIIPSNNELSVVVHAVGEPYYRSVLQKVVTSMNML